MKTSTFVMTASVAAACLSPAAQAADAAERLVRPGWFAGLPITMHVRLPRAHGGDAPNAPSDKHPDVVLYITAPTRAAGQSLPQMNVQTAHGPRVLPPHDDVLTSMVAPAAPADAIGYFVVPGPKASESTVRSQPNPENGWPGAPLAREVFVGTDWVKLTNHAIIEYALAMGWLQLKYFDYGGLVSTSFLDDAVRMDVVIDSEPKPLRPAPSQE